MKNLKMRFLFKIILFFIILIISLFIMSKPSQASTSATYFYGEPIIVEKSKDIELIYNEINIDAETSEIENTFILKNISNGEVETKVSIKLEDERLSTSIKNLEIQVNNIKIQHIYEEEGTYFFYISVPANEAKRIKIAYETENDLRNAKVIKYTLEKLKGQKIKKFKFSVKLPEEDVPLVTGIYPGCFDFEDNVVDVCYYNFNVNSLTSDFIIEKETYKNLLYGSGEELTETQEAVLKKAKSWINDGININYKKCMSDQLIDQYKIMEDLNIEDGFNNDSYYNNDLYESIIKYVIIKQLKEDNKLNLAMKKYYEDYIAGDFNVSYWEGCFPLTEDYIMSNLKDAFTTYGKRVCIDYVESEGDKKLFVLKNTNQIDDLDGNQAELEKSLKLVNTSEREILKTKTGQANAGNPNPGKRIIHIAECINGEKIEATEEEKIEYVNMINADAYIRIVIYDGNVEDRVIGYYNKSDISLIKAYMWNEYGGNEDYYKIVDFDNSYVAENSEIPTFAQSIGYRTFEDNKYVVNYYYGGYDDGLYHIDKLLENSRAKELLNNNRDKNEKIKNEVEEEIENIKISDDTEEFFIKEAEKEINNKKENAVQNILKKLSYRDYIVFGIIGILILGFFISIIISLIKRRKK